MADEHDCPECGHVWACGQDCTRSDPRSSPSPYDDASPYDGPFVAPKARHTIKWVDDLMVGYVCSWDYSNPALVDVLSVEDGIKQCARCEQDIRLHFICSIQEEAD